MIFDGWLLAMIVKRDAKAKSVNPQISQINRERKVLWVRSSLFESV
jgi:hypothetical protein